MKPAPATRSDRDQTQLLVIDPEQSRSQSGCITTRITELPRILNAGDLLVLNDAATFPASLQARDEAEREIEARLLGPARGDVFSAVLFGTGDYHTRTEDRPAPPVLEIGARLRFGSRLEARVESRSALSARLVELRFNLEERALWPELYACGKPIQYAYQSEPLALWSVQTVYATRPWAAEMPSAGRPLSFHTLLALKQRGVELATLTHATGLSSTGDAAIDHALPLPERYDIPDRTVRALTRARSAGQRVIAVGTSVVRALESAAISGKGRVNAGEAISTLRIDARYRPQVVAGLLSGVHSPDESHYDLLSAFANRAQLDAGHARANELGFFSHEFGDACLILPGSLARTLAA